MDLKAYGTLIIGLRLNVTEQSGTTRNFFIFPVCLNMNPQGIAALSGQELAER